MNDDNDDLHLVQECLNGKGKSFEIIVNRYYKTVFRLADKFVHDFDDAEEITQSVFVKAYENLRNYNSNYKFFSWLYRITVNESINYNKRRDRTVVIEENMQSLEPGAEIRYENEELNSKIKDALMELEMIYRAPLVLKHFMGYSYKELSYMLDIPEKTVKSRLYTARQLLKEILLKNRVL